MTHGNVRGDGEMMVDRWNGWWSGLMVGRWKKVVSAVWDGNRSKWNVEVLTGDGEMECETRGGAVGGDGV